MNNVLRLQEYQEVPIRDLEGTIGNKGIRSLSRLNKEHGVEFFRLLHDSVKTTQYVGFVKVGKLTIQVIPKIFGDSQTDDLHFLLQLLSYTKRLKIKEHGLASLGKLQGDFFEVLIYLFAKNLREVLRKDFKKEYVSFEQNTSFLKGKLLMKEHIRINQFDDTRFFCRYDEFTENNLMNQIFKYVSKLLMRISDSGHNKKLLEDIIIYLCDVDDVCIASCDLDRVRFTRLNSQYEPLFNLCRLILQNMSIEFSAASKIETFVFMFDMNRLFEEFVAEFIRKHKSQILVNNTHQIEIVKNQITLGKFFDEFRLIGDLIIKDASGRKILIDTKYKMLAQNLRHGGLSQEDFYQVYSYATSQDEKYKTVILIYPSFEGHDEKLTKVSLVHTLKDEDSVTVHIKTIKLSRIYEKTKKRINDATMVSELNQALNLN